MSAGTPSDPDACAPPPPHDRRRGQRLALAALLAYAALACWELRAVLHPDTVLSPAAFVAHSGPFSAEFRKRVPPGVDLLADTARQFTPWLRYAADHLAQDGELPLWKTTSFCGAPLVGNGQSALFFPTRFVALLLGAPGWVHAATAWLRLVVAAFGGYLLLRHLRASAAAAFVGGLVFGFGGFLIVYRFHPHADVVALLPWLALAADRLALQPGARRIAVVALLAGLQWLAGHPQTALHAQGCVALLALARAWSRRREPDGPGLLRPLLALGAALLLGLGLAALQLGPLLEYAALSESAISREAARGFSLDQPLTSAAFVAALAVAGLALVWLTRGRRVLLPALLLLIATAGALLAGLRCGLTEAFVLPFCADWFGPPTNYRGPLNYVATNGSFIGAALPLCAAGLLFGRPRAVVRAAGACAVFGVLAGMYAPVLTELLRALPVVGLADNGRLVLIGMLGLAVLAGLGLDGLRHAAARPAARARLAAALLAPAIAVFGVLAWSVRAGDILSQDSPGTRLAPGKLEHVGLLDATYEARVRKWERADPGAQQMEDPPSGPDDLTLLGWFAVSEPVRGIRLVYGTKSAVAPSRWALVKDDLPLGDRKARGEEADAERGTLYVFRASFPERDALPPQVPSVELHVITESGLLKSAPLRAHEPTRDDALLFPALPAPPPADGQRQLILLGLATLLVVVACGTGAAALQAGIAAALAALIAVSLLPFGKTLAPGLPRAFFYPRTAGFDASARIWPEQRVVCMDVYALGAEVPTAYGIPDARGYDALTPPRTAMLLRAALDLPDHHTPMEELPTRADPDLSLLGLMAVSLVLDWDGAPTDLRRIAWAGQPAVGQRFPLIENPLALPRARLVSRATLQPNDARALTLLRDAHFDRADAAVLGDAEGVPEALLVPEQHVLNVPVDETADAVPMRRPIAGRRSAAGFAMITFDEPDFVKVDVEPAGPALLLLADTDFPGWRAYVDGVERPVLRANVAFRAVPVGPGERSVEFRYEPRSFAIGLFVSAGSLLVVVGLLVVRRRRPAGAHGAGAGE